jgi:hypothetical protein
MLSFLRKRWFPHKNRPLRCNRNIVKNGENPGYYICYISIYINDQRYDIRTITFFEEEFADTKGVIRIRKSKKEKQHNGQKKTDKRTSNDLNQLWLHGLKVQQYVTIMIN